MKRGGLTGVFLLCALFIPWIVQAQVPPGEQTSPPATASELRIAFLRVSIWPEYDDPRVLIMLRGTFTPDSPLPATVRFTVPEDIEVIGAGMVSEQGELLLHPHQVEQEGEKNRLRFLLPRSEFFVEYYYAPFEGTVERKFT
ncbi:MAG: hypothetical protein D6736_18570, partial [Nitrospinota bacterium]